MFSIENLLSNKYTSKSSQNGKNRGQAEPIATTQTSRKINDGVTEVNSFAGKRETLYLELSAANVRPSSEGDVERETIHRSLENPSSKKLAVMAEMKLAQGSCRKRRHSSRGGDLEESDSDSDRDSVIEEGTTLLLSSCLYSWCLILYG